MLVEITLYQSGFTPEDVFVSTSAEARTTELESLPSIGFIKSAYNPRDPFRIAGNFLSFQRKYDYARYILYEEEGNASIATRYYFIQDFEYVNDHECRLRVIEDILAEVFWDISFANLLPDRATYPDSDLVYPFDIGDISSTYAMPYKEDNLLVYNSNNNKQILGAIVFTCTCNTYGILNSTDLSEITGVTEKPLEYDENQQPLRCATILLPFYYNIDTNTIDRGKIYSGGYQVEYTYGYKINDSENIIGSDYDFSKTVMSIHQIKDILSYTSNGFKVISSMITFDMKPFFSKAEDYILTIRGRIGANGTSLGWHFWKYKTVTPEGALPISFYFLGLNGWDGIYNLSTTIEIIPYTRDPFERLRICFGNQEVTVDPFIFNNNIYSLKVCLSLVPPYSISLYIKQGVPRAPGNTGIELRASPDNILQFQNSNQFLEFNDTYQEWLRANQNAAITGLRVRQVAEISQTALGAGTQIASGNVAGGIVSIASTAINLGGEEILHRLRLKDIKNLPNTLTFKSSVASAWLGCEYFHIYHEKNIIYDTLVQNYERYGFTNGRRLNKIRNHANWDYIRASQVQLLSNSIKLSDIERRALFEVLRNGVRVWYNITTFKHFAAPNYDIN